MPLLVYLNAFTFCMVISCLTFFCTKHPQGQCFRFSFNITQFLVILKNYNEFDMFPWAKVT